MIRKKEAGQALIAAITALAIVLMGFAGLGIDMGYMRYEKRLQQTAADAAAIAGANNIGHGGITAGAHAASAANGFTDGTNNVTVTVNNGPTTGPHANDTAYVEVLVAAVQPTFFMRALGVNNETVTARAVATNLGAGSNSGCLYLIGSTGSSDGIQASGNSHGNVNATSCGILDNGAYAHCGLNITAGTFGVAESSSGNCPVGTPTCTNQSSCPAYNMPAVGDPLSYLTPPAVGTGKLSAWKAGDGPGTYSSMSPSGTLSPGVYVISGGNWSMTGNSSVTSGTGGVMFYLTNGATVDMRGTPTVNLTAPSPTNCPSCASQYDGILFYQDPNDTASPTIGGNASSAFNGVLYFPTVQITFFGSSSTGTYAEVVAWGIDIQDTATTVGLQGAAGLPPGVNLLTVPTLVE